MPTDNGYSNQKKKGIAQFETINNIGSGAYGKSVSSKALYQISLVSESIVSVSDVFGSDGQVQFWNIQITAHGASVGNVFRINAGSLINSEYEIIQVINANNFYILPITDIKPAALNTGIIMGWVTSKVTSDGSPAISIAPSSIAFFKDAILTDVSKDTAVPANSVLLPTENLIAQASLSSIDGKFTTLNAKDFATSAKQDTGNTSLSSIDGKFTTLNAKDFATSAKQDTGNSSLSSIDGKFTTLNAKDFATSAKQDTGNTSLSGINTNTINIPNVITTEGGAQPTHGVVVMGHTGAGVARHLLVDGTGRLNTTVTVAALPTGASTLAEQQTQTTAIGSLTETAPATDTASSGLNGRLQRIAQRLTSLIALFPTSLGTKTAANSLAVTLSSDQAAIPNEIIAGTITNAQVTVGLTAVRATVAGSAPNAARKKLLIKPSENNTGIIYLGSSSVTTANGMSIIGPDRLEFMFDASNYYLISDTAGQSVQIVEVV